MIKKSKTFNDFAKAATITYALLLPFTFGFSFGALMYSDSKWFGFLIFWLLACVPSCLVGLIFATVMSRRRSRLNP